MDELGNGLIARAEATTQTMVFALVVALFVAGIGMWILSRTVLRPLMASVMAMEDLGRGDADLSRRLPEAGDVELSRLAQAFNRFVESVGTEIRKVASLSQDLTGLVGQVKDLGQRLATSSDTTKQRVGAASTQAGDVDVSMQSISAAVEEMTASITEIANHSQNSQELSHRVATMANDAITQVRRLGTSSSEIGDVIRVITSIAEQTNLLALNATIESARAGDAGKGFAVVANEVKELAKSTAEATEDIGRKVEAIQADTRGAIAVIEKIASMVDQVTEAASTIAAAVQEQSATSSEISKSVHRAAQGASGILSEVREVQEAATVTERCRDDLLSASQAISQASSSLQGVTSRYRS